MCSSVFWEGDFRGTHLSDLRRWTSGNWKTTFGVNIYEMISDLLLFEFFNGNMMDRIHQVKQSWKNPRFYLDWWNPITICISCFTLVKTSWILALGVHVHIWPQKIFQELGNLWCGWIAMAEETELKNQLKWARIQTGGGSWTTPS